MSLGKKCLNCSPTICLPKLTQNLGKLWEQVAKNLPRFKKNAQRKQIHNLVTLIWSKDESERFRTFIF
jgi:hypothetical protein